MYYLFTDSTKNLEKLELDLFVKSEKFYGFNYNLEQDQISRFFQKN